MTRCNLQSRRHCTGVCRWSLLGTISSRTSRKQLSLDSMSSGTSRKQRSSETMSSRTSSKERSRGAAHKTLDCLRAGSKDVAGVTETPLAGLSLHDGQHRRLLSKGGSALVVYVEEDGDVYMMLTPLYRYSSGHLPRCSLPIMIISF